MSAPSAETAVVVYDRDLRICSVNKAAEAFFGRPAREFIGNRYQDIFPQAKNHPISAVLASVLETGIPIRLEYDAVSRPGRRVTCSVSRDGDRLKVEFRDQTLDHNEHALVEAKASALGLAIKAAEDATLRSNKKTRALEIINSTSRMLSGELDLQKLLDQLTDASVELSGAAFGAYFHCVTDENGETVWEARALSGAPMEMFTRLGKPRVTNLFKPTFLGDGIVRVDDVKTDPRYGGMGGMPKHHLPVRSYMAIPVVGRDGRVIGGLLLGHPEPNLFADIHEEILIGIANQAAVAIDNAELFARTQQEIDERRRAVEKQEWLLREFNHRVKNILAVVQGIANQTLRNAETMTEFKQAFPERLISLSNTHDLLALGNWSGASIYETIETALKPFMVDQGERFSFSGPMAHLSSNAVSTLSLAFHELATNAIKYGALSVPTGSVSISWWVARNGHLHLVWSEKGGPMVMPPQKTGFGSLLISRMLAQDLSGHVALDYRPGGVVCMMDLKVS